MDYRLGIALVWYRRMISAEISAKRAEFAVHKAIKAIPEDLMEQYLEETQKMEDSKEASMQRMENKLNH